VGTSVVFDFYHKWRTFGAPEMAGNKKGTLMDA
jgi:hypothetical protein